MRVFLLDRNVISLMRDFIKEEEIEARKHSTQFLRYPYLTDRVLTKQHADLQKLLLKNDLHRNIITIFTSAIESGFGRPYDVEEYKSPLLADGVILRRFFRVARTDERILGDIHNRPENVDLIFKEKKIEQYESFLNEVAVYALKTTDSFEITVKRIVSAADTLAIPRSHFIVGSCLSAAFGCVASRRLITPKKRKSGDNRPKYYNTLNDIMVASRIAQFRAFDQSVEYEFVTLDRNLAAFMALCPVIHSSTELGDSVGDTFIKTSPKKELFPLLTQQQFEDLMVRYLGGSSESPQAEQA